jgi:alkylhydroperoxidase/carboxymuconolactone decarboxylase family protein YurZ
LETSHKIGVTKEEMMEAMGIATLKGGTIVVPHLRRAMIRRHGETTTVNSLLS